MSPGAGLPAGLGSASKAARDSVALAATVGVGPRIRRHWDAAVGVGLRIWRHWSAADHRAAARWHIREFEPHRHLQRAKAP